MPFQNKPLQFTSITSPGFFGLNTQDSGVDMGVQFATTAYNAIIDKSGRISARKGWSYTTTSGGTSSTPEAMIEFDNHNGTYTIISAGNNKLFTGETTMTEMSVRNATDTGNATYTITGNNWQFAPAQFSSGTAASAHMVAAQSGHPALMYHKLPSGGGGGGSHAHTGNFGFQRLGDVGNVPTGFTVTTFTPSCALGAFGRMWTANTGSNDKLTVYYSVLLDPSDFTGSGSGVLNLEKVVPGDDRIVALASHNDFLIIFCEKNIVIYNNAANIANIALQDIIVGIGCVARDSVQNIGTDILFLSDSGVRSLSRTIQEKSAPVRDISRNVRDQLISYIAGEDLTKIRSVYSKTDAFYLLIMPTSKYTYCFDVRQFLQDGSARATLWNNIDPKCAAYTHNNRLLFGKADGVAQYTGYSDNSIGYTFSYFTPYLDFGSPSITKILKKIGITVVGGSSTTFDLKWGFDYQTNYKTLQFTTAAASVAEYGSAKYNISEYSATIFIDNIKKQLSGGGNVIQIGVDALINGKPVSIQKLDIYAVTGRTI